jgi:heme/copper-type cytochrome/quinol oxidase subunit 4
MTLMGILSIVAYCVFLAGAAQSFRENGSLSAVRIMLAGVALDIGLTFFPMFGVQSMAADRKSFNAMLIFAMAAGLCVWIVFFTALFMRRKQRLNIYHNLIAATEIGWFISFVAFLYGMYKFA